MADCDVFEMIILNPYKLGVRVTWTHFIWFRIRSSGGLV